MVVSIDRAFWFWNKSILQQSTLLKLDCSCQLRCVQQRHACAVNNACIRQARIQLTSLSLLSGGFSIPDCCSSDLATRLLHLPSAAATQMTG